MIEFYTEVIVSVLLFFVIRASTLSHERRGPLFAYDPPSRVDFSNTTGTVIPCSAEGVPSPSIRWSLADGTPVSDISGLRHIRPDGSLVFPPFRADEYRPDVHSAVYRCIASNAVGSIGSKDVQVKGVANQHYVVEVYDEYVTSGTTAVLRCHIPGFVEEYVTVTQWKEEPTGTVIQPSGTLGGRYLTFSSGTLYIRNVETSHSYRSYKCQTRNRLTGEVVESTTSGRLIVTESRSNSRPRITDAKLHITGRQGEVVALPCASQGYPVPSYHWFRQENGQLRGLPGGHRVSQLEGTLVIHQAIVTDSGHYVCVANNSLGEESAHTHLLITASLSATISPSVQQIHVGRICTINCTVSGHPVHTVVWRKDVGPLALGSRIKQLSRDVLHIDPVQREDRGMYQCFVYNDQESAQAATELSLGDDTPEFQEIFKEETTQPGPSLSLKCVASGNPLPQIVWKLDDAPIPENHRIRFGDYVTKDGSVVSFVNISNVRTEDGGEYQCVANNGVGEVSHVARVNVMGPPVVRRMRNITVVAGEVLVIRCPVAGYPLDNIHWERAGVRLPYNHRQKAHDNGTLEVHHVERATDQGPYICVATNKEGQSAQSTVFVKVQVKPVIEQFSFPKSLREGQRSSALCTVSSGDMPIKIRWFKDGQPIPERSGIRVNEVADYSSTLLFESLGLQHRGNYTCIAGNEAGTVSHTATMVIHVHPRWVIEPSDVSVVKGKGITVDCQTEGFPQPRVRWTKSEGDSPRDFKSIVSSPHLQVFENGSLSIQDASEADAGYYLCQASNGIGQGLSKVVRIKVHIAAHFKSKFTAEMVRKGHNVRLKCEAIGDKPIAIAWMKDKMNIKPDADPRYDSLETVLSTGIVSEIMIRQADRRDSALFSCIASNAFGRDDTNIQLIVQETPDGPQDFRVTETGSRTVKLMWTPPYSGNSPITHYIIHYKDEGGKWHSRMTNVSIPGTESSGTVVGLKPAKLYYFRVLAENRIGRSEASKVKEAMTEEEAPGGAPVKIRAHPTSSQSLKVSWKSPSADLQHGVVKGYYVGYKAMGTSESYVYKTMEIGDGFREECHITGLKRFTKYSIVVQAFNSKGAGPPSDEIEVQTLENDPPTTPPLNVMDRSTSSIQLSWDINYDIHNPVTGYILHQRPEGAEWEETHIPGGHGSHTVMALQCGTKYQFFLTAYNSAGKGEPSEILTAKTDGGAPVAPDKHSILTTNMTAATMNLYTWHDGGCPITSLVVRYRQQQDIEWTVLNDGPLPESKRVDMMGLIPGSWYQVQISASNIAGTTDAEYTFSTLTSADPITPKTVVNKVTAPFYLDLTIILPVAVSVIVIVIVLIVVCLVIKKKHSSDSSHYGTGPYDGRKGSGQETLRMAEMEKSKNHGSVAGSSYYPTPYATTHLSSRRTDDGTDSGYHQLQEEPLYATVKRTPRPPRSDGHIYHCPGLLLEAEQNQMSTTASMVKDGGMMVKLNDSDTERRSSGYRKGRESKYLRNS